MEKLFAPWRIEWVRRRDSEEDEGCVFCSMWEGGEDREELVVARGESSFVVMNNSPYNPGHAMVVPADHVASYEALEEDVVLDHALMKQRTLEAMKAAFEPDGFNTGLNLGSHSGGSIRGHLHTHVVPRWEGDTNFLPATADTKVIVQEIRESYRELRRGFLELEGAVDADGAVEFP